MLHYFCRHLEQDNSYCHQSIIWIMWRVFDPESTRHWAPRAARGAYPITAVKSRIFVQNRRFSNKKWAAKSRIFVQNRSFSNKKWAANLQRTSYWKSDDFVDFQIRSEKLQNHNKEMGYTRTHGRTHAGRTNTIFLVNGFKNPALRAGQNALLCTVHRSPGSIFCLKIAFKNANMCWIYQNFARIHRFSRLFLSEFQEIL